MAKDGLIEVISQQAVDDMNKLIAQLERQISLADTLNAKFKKIKLPSELLREQKAVTTSISDTNKAITTYNTSLKKLEKQQKKVSAGNERNANSFDSVARSSEGVDKSVIKTGKSLINLTGIARNVVAALGLLSLVTFGVNFIKDAITLGRELKGVEFAYKRVGIAGVKAFTDIKRATRGLFSDLNIKKAIVEFDNFGLEVANLAPLLEFVAVTATQTGKGFDYLFNSLVEGLSKQSFQRIDNLGISAGTLREKMVALNLSFADTVTAIAIERSIGAGNILNEGTTAADKFAVSLENIQANFGLAIANNSSINDAITFLNDNLESIIDSIYILGRAILAYIVLGKAFIFTTKAAAIALDALTFAGARLTGIFRTLGVAIVYMTDIEKAYEIVNIRQAAVTRLNSALLAEQNILKRVAIKVSLDRAKASLAEANASFNIARTATALVPIIVAVAAGYFILSGIAERNLKIALAYNKTLIKTVEGQTALTKSANKTLKVMDDMSREFETLDGKVELTSDEQERYNELLERMREALPSTEKALSDYGDTAEEVARKFAGLTSIQRSLAIDRARQSIVDSEAAVVTLSRRLTFINKAYDENSVSIDKSNGMFVTGIGIVKKTADGFKVYNKVLHSTSNLTDEQFIILEEFIVGSGRALKAANDNIIIQQAFIKGTLDFSDASTLAVAKSIDTLKSLREELKLLKEELEDIDVTDTAALATKKGEIATLEKRIEVILKLINGELNKTFAAGTIAYFENIIKGLRKMQKETVLNNEAWEELEKKIRVAKFAIDEITGAYDKFLSLEEDDPITFDEMLASIEANIKAAEELKALLDNNFGFVDMDDDMTEFEAAWELKIRVAKRAQDRIESIIMDSFQRVADIYGVDLGSFRDVLALKREDFETEEEYKKAVTVETMQAISDTITSALDYIIAQQRAGTTARLDGLNREKEIALELAGDEAESRVSVLRRFNSEADRIKAAAFEKEKETKKALALINGALAITQVFAELGVGGFFAAGVVAAATAVEVALIDSQDYPGFEQGTMNSPEGIALVNERRNEVIVGPGGDVRRPEGRNRLVHLEKGSKVYKSEAHFNRELGDMLGGYGINTQAHNIVVSGGNTLTRGDIEAAMTAALSKRPSNNVSIDKNGISTYTVRELTKVNRTNNRVTFRGKNV